MNNVIENFLASFEFSEATKKKYRRVLTELAAIPNLESLDAAGLLNHIQKPAWGNSQQTIALFASRKFLRWLYGANHPALSARIKRITPPPRRSLNPDQALTLLASFDTYTPIGARDLAILAFALDTGFRRAELCSMQLANVDFYTNTAAALCKGGQYKYGIFSDDTAQILRNWLAARKPADGVGALFVSIKTGRQLTGDGMGCIFKRWSRVTGIKISPHDTRSSFATLATIYGAPSRTLQAAGRWSTIEMVEHYTRRLQLQAMKPFLPMANLKRD